MSLTYLARLSLGVSLFALATPALAERFEAASEIEAVTIFAQGARVSREVRIDLPAGRHEIVIPGLPLQTDARALRVIPQGDVILGAVNLATGRLPVTDPQGRPEVIAAEAEVERLIEAVRAEDRTIEAILLRVAAAQEQIAFLRGLSPQADAQALEDIRALTQLIGEEVLAAREAALAAEQEADAARRGREVVADELMQAQQALAALTAPEAPSAVLTVVVEVTEPGTVVLDVSTLVRQASWAPVYDLALDTVAQTLTVERGVVVSQASGEDWSGVALTLSTARPAGQSAPSTVWGRQWSIVPEGQMSVSPAPMSIQSEMDAGAEMRVEGAATMAPVMLGATLTYDYAQTVDIRDGVEALRLSLDSQQFDVAVRAEAVPAIDPSAYLVASFDNTGGEVLLPGEARLVSDGALVGFAALPLIAAGDDLDLGFGPIDGLRLSRSVPVQSEGETGSFISSANQYVQQTVLEVENLTGRAWDVVLREAVPYSAQDALEIALSAVPVIARTDPEGQRGIVEWDLSLPAGGAETVTLDIQIDWPDGQVLFR